MFSIFHGLFTLTALGVNRHNKTTQDEKNRMRARANGDLTYYGSRGNEYLVENNKWVWTKKASNGHDVIADMKTGQIYYDLTEMKKHKIVEERKNKGKTVRSAVSGERFGTYYGKYKQIWGDIDIETNTPVHIISVNCVSFYQELNHGMLLRPIDGESFKYKVGKHSIEEIIELFNTRQKGMKFELENHQDDRVWLSNNYFFSSTHSIYIDNKNQFNIFLTSYVEGNRARWKYIREDNREV